MKPGFGPAALCVAAGMSIMQSASAAPLPDGPREQGRTSVGTFGGARLRLPLGARQTRLSVGLTIAPVAISGSTRTGIVTRYGSGIEFGFASDQPLGLSIAGRPLRTGADRHGPRQNLSTVGTVALVIGGLAVVGLAVSYLAVQDALNDPER